MPVGAKQTAKLSSSSILAAVDGDVFVAKSGINIGRANEDDTENRIQFMNNLPCQIIIMEGYYINMG